MPLFKNRRRSFLLRCLNSKFLNLAFKTVIREADRIFLDAMDRREKLGLSASEAHGYVFRQGLFMRMYEQSLYWFALYVKPLKPMQERVKGGEPVVYGGLPVTSFEKLLEEKTLCAEIIDNGWKWRYAKQAQGADEDFSKFPAWRENVLIIEQPIKKNSTSDRNILDEIRTFNLAGSTPIQTMSVVADWQEYLRNWEGAG